MTGGTAVTRRGGAAGNEKGEPVIPDFAGKVIEIVRFDWSLQIWTADSYSFVLSEPVLIGT